MGWKGGYGGFLVYLISKGVVFMFICLLVVELVFMGICVNVVILGLILGMWFYVMYIIDELVNKIIGEILFKWVGNLMDVVCVVVFFVFEYNGFIIGVILDINGGVYMV